MKLIPIDAFIAKFCKKMGWRKPKDRITVLKARQPGLSIQTGRKCLK